METALRAGIAVYNDGHYHAAHDAWEAHWLDLESGTGDEVLLHGLIQFTAAVHHAHGRNWEGAVGLAESARDYLADLPADYRGCNVGAARRFLAALAADPELVERRRPLSLSHEGTILTLSDCSPAEIAVAATVLADEWGYDEGVVERAGEYALTGAERDRTGTPFRALLRDFVAGDAKNRDIAYQRLRQRVDRRDSTIADVEGLFE
ncbi:DUF309 domain-containing protein [Halovivax limisalsi]|uniref:DUF309 domain-containing protein n=1 Tax=Halovivax limisalsi TaxID=1453760 RepID=UPI001FFC5B0C|nr:DUF309 domain-containing protein [Halovivax limisalsi]